MKAMIFALSLFTALAALASAAEPVFHRDSALPTELRALVLDAVRLQCPASFGLTEDRTTLRRMERQQGMSSTIYSTDLRASYYFDGMHPVGSVIRVESVQYDEPNATLGRNHVLQVSANTDICH